MTTHPPPQAPYHRLPHYLNDAPPSRALDPHRRRMDEANDVANVITDREQSDRDVRTDALDSACRLFAETFEPDADNRPALREVVLAADVFAHYIASGVVPPLPNPPAAAPLHLPLKLEDNAA